jgi:hypothetical protein
MHPWSRETLEYNAEPHKSGWLLPTLFLSTCAQQCRAQIEMYSTALQINQIKHVRGFEGLLSYSEIHGQALFNFSTNNCAG